ncbi:MAG: hypothetical protein J6Y20_07640 [Lachnospiraceae bacterium]|nr:hypothetical protein [Lachnospiraceae bacterium]
MANEQNLKPIQKGELSKEEAKRRGRKGGIASGIARRKKCASRKYLKELLAMTPEITQAEEKMMKRVGIEAPEGIDNEYLMTIALLAKARSGDLRAYDMVHEYLGEDPHTLFEEKRLKVQREAISAIKNSDGFMEAMGSVVEEVFEDGGDTPEALED